MLPISLKISAFGPFASTVNIDFTKLKQSKIFMISGPTGSGKTTIFDAISYSLYGVASGGDRKPESFRSHFAKKDTKTEVEFTFIINNKQYTIMRSPRQDIKKLRGEGTKIEEMKVTLVYDDNVITAASEVKEAITEIIGLDDKQFRKIVLLPQGEFSKMLFSNSNEKVDIFRKIFDTTQISKTQVRLREELKLVETEYLNKVNEQKTLINQFGTNLNSNNIEEYYNHINRNKDHINHHLQLLTTKINDISRIIDNQLTFQENNKKNEYIKKQNIDIEEQLAALGFENLVIDNQISLLNYRNLLKQLNAVNAELNHLEKKSSDTNIKLESAMNKQSIIMTDMENLQTKGQDIELIKAEVITLNNLLTNFQQIEDLSNQLITYNSQLDNFKTNLSEINHKFADYEKLELANSQNISDLTNLEAEYNVKTRELEKYRTYQELVQQLNIIQTKYSQEHDEFIKLQKTKKKLEESSRLHLINQLTAELVDGQPCLVCGSTTHISTYKSDPHQDFNQDSSQLQAIVDRYTTVQTNIGFLNGQIANINEQIRNMGIDDAFDLGNYESEINRLDTKIKSLKKSIEAYSNIDITKLKTRKENIVQSIGESTGLITGLNQQIKTLKLTVDNYQLADIENKVAANIEATEVYEHQLTLTANQLNQNQQEITKYQFQITEIANSKQKLLNSKTTLTAELNRIVIPPNIALDDAFNILDDIEVIAAKITGLKTTYQENCGQIKQFISNYDNYQPINISEYEVNQSTLISEQAIYVQLFEEFQGIASSLQTTLLKIKEDSAAIAKLSVRYQQLHQVVSVANGDTKSKISFERYILQNYFQKIIMVANTYLKPITNNRYTLSIKKDSSGRAGAGLDLDIFDLYTSKYRDVKSLSGGESFKTALALALGLSEVVQMESGGIKIDTIFIDEGFGTLDTQSIDAALDTLLDIESSGRMVGVISHVEEIKQRINNKIEVTATNDGSKLITSFN